MGGPLCNFIVQVGGSDESYETFKMEWYCQKDKLILWKYERGVECLIRHYDVFPLLKEVFIRAFGQVEVKKQAIFDCDGYL